MNEAATPSTLIPTVHHKRRPEIDYDEISPQPIFDVLVNVMHGIDDLFQSDAPPSLPPPGTGEFKPWRGARDLVRIHVGAGSLHRLGCDREEAQYTCDVVPALALPPDNPAEIYAWPVKNKTVRIIGRIPKHDIRALIVALIKAGADTATGGDTDGDAHIAHHPRVRR